MDTLVTAAHAHHREMKLLLLSDASKVATTRLAAPNQRTCACLAVRRVPVADAMWRPHGMISMDDIVSTFGHEFDAMADVVNAQSTQMEH